MAPAAARYAITGYLSLDSRHPTWDDPTAGFHLTTDDGIGVELWLDPDQTWEDDAIEDSSSDSMSEDSEEDEDENDEPNEYDYDDGFVVRDDVDD